MFPEKYVKDLESSNRRDKWFGDGSVAIAFFVCFAVFGGLMHEFAHIFVLEWSGCIYSTELHFSVIQGVYGSVAPLCDSTAFSKSAFYAAGYMSTLVTGFLLIVKESTQNRTISAAGTGLVTSMLLNLGSAGDIPLFLEAISVSPDFAPVVTGFLFLGVFSIGLYGVEIMVSEREESDRNHSIIVDYHKQDN